MSPHQNNILILIQPALAGPEVSPDNYWKPEWILWPPELANSQGGRLMSIAGGADWVGDGYFFRSNSHQELERRGFFRLRTEQIGSVHTSLLVNRIGAESSDAQLLSFNEDTTDSRVYNVRQGWPKGDLMVAEAASWDEVRTYEKSTDGRVMVVEYPPRAETSWSRFWLFGHNWPNPIFESIHGRPNLSTSQAVWTPEMGDHAVPGLIRAKHAIELVVKPETFSWTRVRATNWSSANRYFEAQATFGTWMSGVWMIAAAVLSIWGSALVSGEFEGRYLPVLLEALLLSPASVNICGQCERLLGPGSWPMWLFLSNAVALLGSGIFRKKLKSWIPKAHPLLSTFSIGLVAMCLIDPVWGFMSPLFSNSQWPESPVAIAAMFGYLVGVTACIRGSFASWKWLAVPVSVIVLASGVLLPTWWSFDLGAATFVPFFAYLVGSGRYRRPYILLAFFWPTSIFQIASKGLVWSPSGLLFFGRDLGGLNLFDYIEFLKSWSLYSFLLIGGGIALFGFRFFFHQLRSLCQLDLRRESLVTASGVSFAFGILHPIFLYVGLVLSIGSLSALLYDGVQTM